MGEKYTRRRLLQAGVAATGLASIPGNAGAGTRLSNTIEIESDGGGLAAYEFTVSGDLRQEDWDDHVDGNRAYGHVGPDRGADTFSYSGDLTGFCLAGPATAYRNGVRTEAQFYPAPDGTLSAGDFPTGFGASVLRVESDGGGVAAYEFEVNGSVSQVDWDDHVTGRHVYGHVGPDRGADEFEVSGDVTRFSLAGPATAYLDGTALSADSGGGERTVLRASPDPEITARPGTTVLFEAAARGYRGDRVRGDWYVDGQQWVGPGAFHGQTGGPGLTTFSYGFTDEGTHHVRADLYDGDRSDGDPIGSVDWTVRVSPDGNRPPSVELVEPSGDATVTESPDRRRFEATASDPEGALDRMVWWQNQCDAVVAIDPASGASASSAVSFAPDYGCPLGVRAIDRDGAVSELEGWPVERNE